MEYYVVASGSKGNCCVVVHEQKSIIIDCGTTKRYLKQAFSEIEVDYTKASALLVTHAHSDHIAQLKMFSNLPVYSMQKLDVPHLYEVVPFEVFSLEGFEITVLPLSHDCPDTIGFLIEAGQEKLVYITDTGYMKEEIQAHIKDADYYIFESNHDVEYLMKSNRPIYIKQRITSDTGHLCNIDSAKILANCIGEHTKQITLAHLSQEGNTKECALQCLYDTLQQQKKKYDHIEISAAEQFGIIVGGKKNV